MHASTMLHVFQGSDGAVKIWLTENWSEMCKIEEGFRNSQAPARISWTPDGSFLGTVAGKYDDKVDITSQKPHSSFKITFAF